VLATLGVPFDPGASAVAVDSAVEAGQPLLLLNCVEMVLGPNAMMGLSWEVEDDADAVALAEPARLAASLGVDVRRLRVCSPHPVDALVEVVAEHDPALLVFGPDRARLRPRRYRKAAKAVRERCACLLWLDEEQV
jgi:nucleotide-binding universal stress UspA family protein